MLFNIKTIAIGAIQLFLTSGDQSSSIGEENEKITKTIMFRHFASSKPADVVKVWPEVWTEHALWMDVSPFSLPPQLTGDAVRVWRPVAYQPQETGVENVNVDDWWCLVL